MNKRMVEGLLNYYNQSANAGALVPLDYLEGTGDQHIDTGLALSSDLDIEASIQFVDFKSGTGGESINGAYLVKDGKAYRADFAGVVSTGYFFLGCSSNPVTTNVEADYQRHTFHINTATGAWSIDDVSGSVEPDIYPEVSRTVFIFDRNSGWVGETYRCRQKVYWVKIKKGGVLVRDYVPMLRLTDSKPGLYDKVTQKFYTNSRTGTDFTYRRLPDRYARLEWLASAGAAKINTLVPGGNDNLKIVATFKYDDWSRYRHLYGAYSDEGANTTRIILDVTDTLELLTYMNTKAGGGSTRLSNVTKKAWHEFEMSKRSVTLDGITKSVSLISGTALANSVMIHLFNRSGLTDNTTCTVYFSHFQIYDGDTLIRDYIPCYDFLTEEYGMYDICESICPLTDSPFYTNAGSGNFTAPQIVASKYTRVNYIESLTTSASEAPYIVLPINTNEISRVSIDYMPTIPSNITSDHFLGSNYGFAIAVRSNGLKWYNADSTAIYTPNQRVLLEETMSGTTKSYLVDGSVCYTTTHNTSQYQNNPFYVFGLSQNVVPDQLYSGPCLKGRCYSVSYWDLSGELKGVFVPTVRKSDSAIGLLDLYGSICPLTGTSFYVSERGNANLTFG